MGWTALLVVILPVIRPSESETRSREGKGLACQVIAEDGWPIGDGVGIGLGDELLPYLGSEGKLERAHAHLQPPGEGAVKLMGIVFADQGPHGGGRKHNLACSDPSTSGRGG